MTIKNALRKKLWRMGWDLSRVSVGNNALARRKRLLEYYRVTMVLDVGANIGQYGKQLRDELNFQGKIVSFEPLSSALLDCQQL